jgi:quaternary ammonium compound-resistance protein SugE
LSSSSSSSRCFYRRLTQLAFKLGVTIHAFAISGGVLVFATALPSTRQTYRRSNYQREGTLALPRRPGSSPNQRFAVPHESEWQAWIKSGLIEGFTRLWPSVRTVAAMAVSMYLLALAARGLPMGIAYDVWTGIGAVGTAIVGMILFDEPREWMRLLCIGLIVAGVLGLKLVSK